MWSLLVSRIPHHTDLHPGRNMSTSWFILSVLFLTIWFILSVLFLTGCETSVVQHMSGIHHHTDLHPGNLPDQLVHSVCVVFDTD